MRHPARNATHPDRVARTHSQKITVEHFSGADRAATGLQATYEKNYFSVMSITSPDEFTIYEYIRKLDCRGKISPARFAARPGRLKSCHGALTDQFAFEIG